MGHKIKHPGLLHEVEQFLSESGMGASYFGKKAVGNSELVKRLRAGRRIGLDTSDKLRAFILTERQRPEFGVSAAADQDGRKGRATASPERAKAEGAA